MRKFKEYPKMIYPAGKEPVVVRSVEEENSVLGKKKELEKRLPLKQQDRPQEPEKIEKPKEDKGAKLIKCKWCGKGYRLPLHLHPHERRCKLNPENMKDADGK